MVYLPLTQGWTSDTTTPYSAIGCTTTKSYKRREIKYVAKATCIERNRLFSETTKKHYGIASLLLTHSIHAVCHPKPMNMPQNYKEISKIARKRRDDALDAFFIVPEIKEEDLPQDLRSYPASSRLLTAEELEIVRSDTETLLKQIRERKLTSFAATTAFCKAAVIAQKLVCCLTLHRHSDVH